MNQQKMPLLAPMVALAAVFLGSVFYNTSNGEGPLGTPVWLLPIFLLAVFLTFMFYAFERIEVGSGLPIPQRVSAILVVLAAVFGAVYTLGTNNAPLLGLDLQGGVSVVLEPKVAGDQEITDEALDLTVERLRERIDQIGVAEPAIGRQGNNIVVGLPGAVENQQETLRRLQQTAELRFRPVIGDLGSMEQFEALDRLQQLDADGVDLDSVDIDEDGNIVEADPEPEAEGTAPVETVPVETVPEETDSEESFGAQNDVVPVGLQFQDDDTVPIEPTSTTTGESSNPDEVLIDETGPVGPDVGDILPGELQADEGVPGEIPTEDDPVIAPTLEQGALSPARLAATEGCGLGVSGAEGSGLVDGLTPDDADVADAYVVLLDSNEQRLCLGPTMLTGETVEGATVTLNARDGWTVNPSFLAGANGIDQFNAAALVCFQGDPDVCPATGDGPGRLAVVLDHRVISAPSINSASFGRSDIQITGAFTEDEARQLAEALRFGSLPLELEPQETRTVSASIGQDVMRSGVIAGLIGLALVAVYLLAYYRLAGLVAISGLTLSALLLWTIVSWFSVKFGLALSLAGVVGLIVSIGVSTDSNIVYFENVKDSYRSGRRVPTAVERAYESAISTIVKADVVSLIAAVLLYALTVGAVRGFAFYLGLATILDLIISWMFMRPALGWLARRAQADDNPRMLGLPAEGGAQ